MDPLEAQTLADLAAAGGQVLEVGSAYGYSTIVMALAGGWVLAVDPHHEFKSLDIMRANIAAYDVAQRIEVLVGASQQVLPDLYDQGASYDLVFVDGDHSLGAVTHDAAWCWQLVREGGYLACHDYGPKGLPGVTEALDCLYPDGPSWLVRSLWVKQKL